MTASEAVEQVLLAGIVPTMLVTFAAGYLVVRR